MSELIHSRPAIEIDDSRWPLVVTVLHDGFGEHDVTYMLERYEAMLRRRERYVGLVDLSDLSRPPGPSERRCIAKWSKERDPELSRFSLGYAIIVPNSLIRGALTALMWIHKTAAPETYVADGERALRWCIEQLERAHVPVAPQIRSYRHKLSAA